MAYSTVNTCNSCGMGCAQCSGATCIQCVNGFLLVGPSCQCPVGRGYNAVMQACYFCASNCQSCLPNFQLCTTCAVGYGLLSNNTCSPCTVANCLQCPSSPNTCVGCINGYGLSLTNSCQICVTTNCLKCSAN